MKLLDSSDVAAYDQEWQQHLDDMQAKLDALQADNDRLQRCLDAIGDLAAWRTTDMPSATLSAVLPPDPTHHAP